MSRACIVAGCPSGQESRETFSLHRCMKQKPEILKLWLQKIDIRNPIDGNSKICSLHFNDSCFVNHGLKRLLLPDAIPLPYKVIQFNFKAFLEKK